MVLTELQYQYVIDSVARLRLTVSERYKVHNEENEHRILSIFGQMGIDPELPKCRQCDGYYWSKVMLSKIEPLIKEYENQIGSPQR